VQVSSDAKVDLTRNSSVFDQAWKRLDIEDRIPLRPLHGLPVGDVRQGAVLMHRAAVNSACWACERSAP
jgi:hypothetical protein